MAAGVELAKHGARTLLLDENSAAGGRIWQALEARGASDKDEEAGLALTRSLAVSPVDIQFNANVWAIEPDGTVFWSQNGMAHSSRARRVILATGTTERPTPMRGWT